MHFGPAEVHCSDGEGNLNDATAKAVPEAKGAELTMRARGQRATTCRLFSPDYRMGLCLPPRRLPSSSNDVSPCAVWPTTCDAT
eukprot:1063928-Pyramimonas_sp.AAC.1